MKGPLFKAGQSVVLPAFNTFPESPQIVSGRLYTVDHHIWDGTRWYLTLKEFGALIALSEDAFRAATKAETTLAF